MKIKSHQKNQVLFVLNHHVLLWGKHQVEAHRIRYCRKGRIRKWIRELLIDWRKNVKYDELYLCILVIEKLIKVMISEVNLVTLMLMIQNIQTCFTSFPISLQFSNDKNFLLLSYSFFV
jgi:hypothetical protein